MIINQGNHRDLMSNPNISRLSVAELKQLVARPDVVEMHDVTARDPRLVLSETINLLSCDG